MSRGHLKGKVLNSNNAKKQLQAIKILINCQKWLWVKKEGLLDILGGSSIKIKSCQVKILKKILKLVLVLIH